MIIVIDASAAIEIVLKKVSAGNFNETLQAILLTLDKKLLKIAINEGIETIASLKDSA